MSKQHGGGGVEQAAAAAAVAAAGAVDPAAENARWLVHTADWGYLSSLDPQTQAPSAQVASYSDGPTGASSGRLFFYLMAGEGTPASFAGALTMSEAVTEPAGYQGTAVCGDRADVDPQVGDLRAIASFRTLIDRRQSSGFPYKHEHDEAH